jgi:hypothetical protein
MMPPKSQDRFQLFFLTEIIVLFDPVTVVSFSHSSAEASSEDMLPARHPLVIGEHSLRVLAAHTLLQKNYKKLQKLGRFSKQKYF